MGKIKFEFPDPFEEDKFKGEVWRDIVGYEGFYMVSNKGRVKSLERFVNGKGDKQRKVNERILKLGFSEWYYHVSLNGKIHLVHRLVAMAFISNHNNLPVVNHKDRNGLNNSVDNLEWCTQSDNVRHWKKWNASRVTR